MDHAITLRRLMLSGFISLSLTMPALADDLVVVNPPSKSGDPVYVWEGNPVNEEGKPAMSAPSNTPQARQESDVRFITGGIGSEEREALEASKKEYNLHITSSNVQGEFDGDTKITIINHDGRQLLSADAGPLFYAELSPGAYTVEAVSSGRTKKQHINVGAGKTSNVYFRW